MYEEGEHALQNMHSKRGLPL